MPKSFRFLCALFCAFILPTCSSLQAENASAPVTRINRIKTTDASGKVEFDSGLTFKNNSDAVHLASELGISGGVVGVTEIAGHNGVVTKADLGLLPTPADYGATNDGTLHPISEWIPSRYTDIAAVRAFFGSDVQTTDSIDRIVIRYLRQHFKSIYLPPNPNALTAGNGYYLDKPVEAYDDGQQIIGQGRQGPYGSVDGTVIVVGPGIDGLRHAFRACSVRDLSLKGSTVPIHSVTSTGGAQAIMVTSADHGLSAATITLTNTTGITSGSASDVPLTTTVTTASAHGLTSGDFIQIFGSSETGLNGIWRVRVVSPTTLKILNTSQQEIGVSTSGTGGSFRRVYEVGAGPDFSSGVQAAVPAVVGLYHVTVTDSTHLNLYDEDNSPVVLTTNATNDTGTLYTSRHLLHFGSGDDFDNTQNSPDPGHSFFIQNVFAHDAQCGFYTGDSDASSGEGLVAYTCAVGLWIDGALDILPFKGTWMTQCCTAGYRITRNSGLQLNGGGGADNKVFVDMSRDYGNKFIGLGNYLEGVMRTGPAPFAVGGPGTGDPYVEVGPNNSAWITGLVVQDGGVTNNCHFHTAGSSRLTVAHCEAGLHAWQKGSSLVFGDGASELTVSYQGATSDDYSIGKYQASDAFTEDWGNALPSPTLAMVGQKRRMIPYGGKVTEAGEWTCENFSGSPTGTPVWVHTSFDILGAAAGGTGNSSYTAGDLLYATGSTTLTKLPKGSDDQVLTIDNSTHLPVWKAAPGNVTTYTVSATGNHNMGFTTLTSVADLTISSVAVGDYSVYVRGTVNYGGGGDAGWKWDLKGGTAVFSSVYAKHLNTCAFAQAGTGVQMYWMGTAETVGPTGQGTCPTGNIYDGEDWTTITGGGGGNYPFDYYGVLHVSAAGSVIFRQANHSGSGDTGTLGQCVLTLIKQ